ncbi:hypothetical protein FRB90_010487, partial [Tulasnella sp. 427]
MHHGTLLPAGVDEEEFDPVLPIVALYHRISTLRSLRLYSAYGLDGVTDDLMHELIGELVNLGELAIPSSALGSEYFCRIVGELGSLEELRLGFSHVDERTTAMLGASALGSLQRLHVDGRRDAFTDPSRDEEHED